MTAKEINVSGLARAALEAREHAYAPYSHFSVGAALLTKDGTVFTGSNIENISFPAGSCAERTAIFTAVHQGYRAFAAIAVAGGPAGKAPADYCMPCGICRQVLMEFCDPSLKVYIVRSEEDVKEYTLADILPLAFSSLQSE